MPRVALLSWACVEELLNVRVVVLAGVAARVLTSRARRQFAMIDLKVIDAMDRVLAEEIPRILQQLPPETTDGGGLHPRSRL